LTRNDPFLFSLHARPMPESQKIELDIKQIMERLPHRYPMLLVDRVLEMVPGKHIVAIKNVTLNEPLFTGHFPQHQVMPGVLIDEALAQASAPFSFEGDSGVNPANPNMAYYLVGADEARYRRPVVPGDQLRLGGTAEKISRSICKYATRATVDGQLV